MNKGLFQAAGNDKDAGAQHSASSSTKKTTTPATTSDTKPIVISAKKPIGTAASSAAAAAATENTVHLERNVANAAKVGSTPRKTVATNL
jgi:hypothetical protein